MHMLPDQAVLPVRSRRVYTIRARNRCKCEAPGNKATGDSKHHLPPSITPTVMCQDVCDPPVQNLTAPCTCARVSELFVFNKRGTQKKNKRRDGTRVLFVTTHEGSTPKKRRCCLTRASMSKRNTRLICASPRNGRYPAHPWVLAPHLT